MCYRCSMLAAGLSEKQIEANERRWSREMIEKHGWYADGVGPLKGGLYEIHTHGLPESFPFQKYDLVVKRLEEDMVSDFGHPLLEAAIDFYVRNGTPIVRDAKIDVNGITVRTRLSRDHAGRRVLELRAD